MKRARDKDRLDEKLDEALKETFPASDPVALSPEAKEQQAPAEPGESRSEEAAGG